MHLVKYFLIILLSLSLLACVTSFNKKSPYIGIKTLYFDDNKGYEFKNEKSKKLLIIIEGSGWNSVLGYKQKQNWRFVGTTAQLLQVLQDRYTIFIPERFNWEIGKNYKADPDELYRYTFDNLLESYKATILEYLSHNEYESIVMFGVSEGALLIPILYNQLNNKNINQLVSMNYGGLSLHEMYPILAESQVTPVAWKKLYNQIIEVYSSKPYPNAIEKGYIGMPMRFWSSIVDIRPFDYYIKINIPVLFIHGINDFNVPVESTQYIEKNLPNKPFEYLYYKNLGHTNISPKQANEIREDIAKWIIAHDK
ncbi:hypothetical protein FACS189494_00030 [Spirochaetia bacterium]|nr:hypothetical protein FACS189494_00030 [Spirochaetia bacterium]